MTDSPPGKIPASPIAGDWQHRWHPLRREWVLIAAHVGERPWSGANASAGKFDAVDFDPQCYLCPGNRRVNGQSNPDYQDVFVFENDFASWSNLCPPAAPACEGLFKTHPVAGAGRVVCYERRHNLTLAQLPKKKVFSFLKILRQEYRTLGRREEIRYVHIFENKGEIVGVSNPHPHCQIYGANQVFPLVLRELEACRTHADETGLNLILDMLRTESEEGTRMVFSNSFAGGFVPFAARFPYETYLVPHRHLLSFDDMDDGDLEGLAHSIQEMAVRYDNLYRMSFPYVMCFYQAPVDGGNYSQYQFHIKFMPLLRNPSAQKFLAGPELGGEMMINPKCPEQAAHELAGVSAVHFLEES